MIWFIKTAIHPKINIPQNGSCLGKSLLLSFSVLPMVQCFFCHVVDCCLANCVFLLSFSKPFNCRLENGVVLDVGVVVVLAVGSAENSI